MHCVGGRVGIGCGGGGYYHRKKTPAKRSRSSGPSFHPTYPSAWNHDPTQGPVYYNPLTHRPLDTASSVTTSPYQQRAHNPAFPPPPSPNFSGSPGIGWTPPPPPPMMPQPEYYSPAPQQPAPCFVYPPAPAPLPYPPPPQPAYQQPQPPPYLQQAFNPDFAPQ